MKKINITNNRNNKCFDILINTKHVFSFCFFLLLLFLVVQKFSLQKNESYIFSLNTNNNQSTISNKVDHSFEDFKEDYSVLSSSVNNVYEVNKVENSNRVLQKNHRLLFNFFQKKIDNKTLIYTVKKLELMYKGYAQTNDFFIYFLENLII